MNHRINFMSKRIKTGQVIFVLFSVVLIIADLLFLMFDYSNEILLVVLITVCFIGVGNYIQNDFYEIDISDEIIVIQNVWRKKTFDLKDLLDIRKYNYPLPIPMDSFIEFKIKGQGKIISQVQPSLSDYVKIDGMNKYIQELRNELVKK